ncbi:MAG: fructose PTS transporter subunit IIA [Marinisporobacter sp.]|nr:fructose PTS transporter subunit IIA [Marinisporobacter sp.]
MNNLITREMIALDLEATNKNEVIEKLAKMIDEQERLNDYEVYIRKVNEREETCPTSLGFSFAIPHGKCDAVKNASVAFARLKEEVQWSDEEKAKYIFLIGVSDQEAGDQHLKILAQLSRKIMREEFREKIEIANSVDEMLNILSE